MPGLCDAAAMQELRQVEGLPPGLLDAEAHQLADLLGGPTFLRIKRRVPSALSRRESALSASVCAPIFVSVLLHGNETSGWDGLRISHLAQLQGDAGRPPSEGPGQHRSGLLQVNAYVRKQAG